MTFGRRLLILGIATIVGIIGVDFVGERDDDLEMAFGATPDPSSPIPADPELRLDSLPNGLRYYIRPHGKRGEPIELRLLVNAGSVLEDEDQRGLAHAVEHMAIRGSTRFPRRAVDAFMARLGMRSGEGVNGSTSADHTEYRLTLPSDSGGVLDTALAMLSGIASDASFDAAEARIEAGIVMGEWRTGRDADQRRDDAELALLLEGSRYALRPPIGDTTVLRRFDVEPLRRFYQTWYRPERMAIVAVGGFNPYTVETLIKQNFGAMAVAPPTRPPSAPPPPPLPGKLRAATHVDAEATETRVTVSFPRPAPRYALMRDMRSAYVRTLWRDILVTRLEDAALEPGASIVSISAHSTETVRGLRTETVSATVSAGGAQEAVEAIVGTTLELAQAEVSPSELEESVQIALHDARNANESLDSSYELVEEYSDHFFNGNSPITHDIWFRSARSLLPTITPADIRAFAASLALDSGAVVMVSANPGDRIARATAAELASYAREARVRPTVARTTATDEDALIDSPRRGSIDRELKIDSVDALDWRLANGMRVILKPTSFAAGQVHLRAVLPGGSSLASSEDYPSAYLSDAIVRAVGVGSMTKARLDRRLRLSSVSLSATVSDEAIVFSGSSSDGELRELLELLHAWAMAPRRDTVAFRRYQQRMQVFRHERARDPEEVFHDTVTATVDGTNFRSRRDGVAFIGEVSLDRALAFWKERFAHAGGMTVVLTGDLSPWRVKPLVKRYLASLPAGEPERARDLGVRFPSGIVRRELASGTSRKSRTTISISGPYAATVEQAAAVDVVHDLIETAMDTRLRETLGATYGVSTTAEYDLIPPARYVFSIDFEAEPERMDRLAAEVLGELKRLAEEGPTQQEFESVRAAGVRDVDDRIEENEYWASELASHAQRGWSFGSILGHRDQRAAMTRDDMRRACAAWIRLGGYVRVTMRP